jgi:hypothetical protein
MQEKERIAALLWRSASLYGFAFVSFDSSKFMGIQFMKKTILVLSGLLLASIIYADKSALALRNQASDLLQKEAYRKSEKTLLKALNIELKKYGAKSSQTAQSQLVHAEIMFYLGKYEYAINTAKSSLKILGQIHGADSLEAAKAGYVLSTLFLRTGQIVLAEATIRKTLTIQLSQAKASPDTAASRIVLAEILSLKDKNKTALLELQKAQKNLKKDSHQMAQCMVAYSKVCLKIKKYPEALKAGRQAVAICNKRWGADSLHSAQAAISLVKVYTSEKKFVEARKLLPVIAGIVVKKVGVKHLLTVEMMTLRGFVYMREGELQKSKILLNKATTEIQHILPGKNLKTAYCMFYSAQLNAALQKYPAAEIMFKYAISAFATQLGKTNLIVASCLNELSLVAARNKKFKTAVLYAEKTTQIYIQLKGKENPMLAPPFRNLAYMYTRAGKSQKAIATYILALKLYEKIPDPKNDISIARICANVAALYGRTRQPAKAKGYCKKALAICDKNKHLKNKKIAMVYFLCSFYYYSTKDFKKAYDLVNQAKTILIKAYGPNYPAIRNYDKVLLQIKQKMK